MKCFIYNAESEHKSPPQQLSWVMTSLITPSVVEQGISYAALSSWRPSLLASLCSKGSANFVMRWKESKRDASISFTVIKGLTRDSITGSDTLRLHVIWFIWGVYPQQSLQIMPFSSWWLCTLTVKIRYQRMLITWQDQYSDWFPIIIHLEGTERPECCMSFFAEFSPDSSPADEDNRTKWVPMAAFECRGCEPFSFTPEVWICLSH